VVQFWSIGQEGECDTPLQTLCLDISEPLSVCLCQNFKLLLVVFSEQWVVYTAKAGKEILNMKCPDIGGWKSGAFVTKSSVIVWSKEGNGYVYNLPAVPNAVPLSFLASSSSTTLNSSDREQKHLSGSFEKNREEELVIQKHAPPSNFRSALLSKLNIIDKANEETSAYAYVCMHVPTDEDTNIFIDTVAAAAGNVFVTGTELGKISVWIAIGTEKVPPGSRISPWTVSRTTKKAERGVTLWYQGSSDTSVT